MDNVNFFNINREIFESDIFLDQVKFRLFIFLIGKVSFKKEGYKKRGYKMGCGEVLISLNELIEKLEYIENNKIKFYQKSTISRKLSDLVKEERISMKKTKLGTVIKVLNYGFYQGLEEKKVELATDLQRPATDLQQTCNGLQQTCNGLQQTCNGLGSSYITNNGNNENNENNENNGNNVKKQIQESANNVYEYYHSKLTINKSGKQQSIKNISKLLKGITLEKLKICIDNYRSSSKFEKCYPDYIIQCSNFFGQKATYKDYLEKEKICKSVDIEQQKRFAVYDDFINGGE